jgi:hypothetical protein
MHSNDLSPEASDLALVTLYLALSAFDMERAERKLLICRRRFLKL